MGRINTQEPQAFTHRIPRVNTRFRYRFRAGDAKPSDWYTVTPRPPPTLASLGAVISPPAYTGLPRREVDLRAEGSLPIPDGAQLQLWAVSTMPIEALTVSVAGGDPVPMQFDPQQERWEAALAVTTPGVINIEGVDAYQQKLRETVAYQFTPDQPPLIEILEPKGRMALPVGEVPRIEFRVQDDYGLASVKIERVDNKSTDGDADEPIARWEPEGSVTFEQRWAGTVAARRKAVAYRITAVDNAPGGGGIARSQTIVFEMPTAANQADKRDSLEAEAVAGLKQVIELQERNIEQCQALRPDAQQGAPDLWSEPFKRQDQVRQLTRTLLANPLRPLGGRTESVSRLYANEMMLAVDAIRQIGTMPAAQRDRQIGEALALQAMILRQLKASEAAADRAQVERRQTGVSAMLTALIEGQSGILEQLGKNGSGATAAAVAGLVDRQDALSEDTAAFEAACVRDAASVRGNDAAFADLLEKVARETRERRIREDMLQAAGRLEDRKGAEAVVLAARAHGNLVQLQEMLDRVGLQREQDQHAAMAEAVGQAKEKLQRIEDMHKLMQEALDAVRGSKDKDDVAFDLLAEEFVEIAKKNKEAMLQIPVDLHVFADLNVGNELVEDVFTIFQEIEQAAADKQMKPEDVVEMAFKKNLEAMDAMAEAMDRMDATEMWLGEKADALKVVTEAIDREEMPEAGIALGALAAAVQDLIGDLLEEDEDVAAAADDGATTHALGDIEAGGDVIEGDLSSFGAQGQSGNQRPDHKEQDGRSNTGRQGMSTGETAAGGTIGEGDENIQERRTEDPVQSGMVQLDGDADTVATGGGKLGSGKADDVGMEGGSKRLDSTEEGSPDGMAALLARDADAIFAKASLSNVRAASLQTAAHHLSQVDDAIAKGDIGRVAEHRQLAVSALRRAQVELSAAPSTAIALDATPSLVDNAVQAGADMAPPKYQAQVADYYKLLNEEL